MIKINIVYVITAFLILCGFNNGYEPLSGNPIDSKVVELSPSPATSFIKVNIDKMIIPTDGSIKVSILNASNVMVFSATKSENQFSIYIGGLPNGTYKLLLKLNNTDVEKSFEVKH